MGGEVRVIAAVTSARLRQIDRRGKSDFPLIHHSDAVAQIDGFGDVVGNEQDRSSPQRNQPQQIVLQFLAGDGVGPPSGLASRGLFGLPF